MLTPADADAEVLGGPAWTPLLSSAAEHTKHQVAGESATGTHIKPHEMLRYSQTRCLCVKQGQPTLCCITASRRPALQPVAGRVLRMPHGALHQRVRRLGRQERGVRPLRATAGAWQLCARAPFGVHSAAMYCHRPTYPKPPTPPSPRWPRSTMPPWWRARSCRARRRRRQRAKNERPFWGHAARSCQRCPPRVHARSRCAGL